jgi:RNA polymerase sigma-70 factor (family 1)
MLNFPDDRDLIKSLVEGNLQAYKTLFLKYNKKLYYFAYGLLKSKEDAEEVVHDIFVKIWEKKDGLNADLSFNGYICTLTKNHVYNLLRKKRYDQTYKKHLLVHSDTTHNETENSIILADLEHYYQDAIERLPPRRKLIFTLSRNEGLSHKEIAEQLNISENTVKEQMSQALKFLKEYLVLNKGAITLLFLISNN